MKPRPQYGVKAEDVPAPTPKEFTDFLKKLVSVPKAEIDLKQAEWKKRNKKKS